MTKGKTLERLSERIIDIMFEYRSFEDNPLTEMQLTEILHISRSHIRDALVELEQDGLVERRKKKGVYLKKPTMKIISEIYDLRMVLESYAARLVCENATEVELAELDSIGREYTRGKNEGSYRICEEANVLFHKRLVEISGNTMLKRMMTDVNLIGKVFKLAYFIKPNIMEDRTPYPHEAIVERLRARDPNGTEEILKNHIQRGKQKTLEFSLGFKIRAV